MSDQTPSDPFSLDSVMSAPSTAATSALAMQDSGTTALLVIDLENAKAEAFRIGLPRLDPAWIKDKAIRIVPNTVDLTVSNLEKPDPLTGGRLIDNAGLKPWEDAGFFSINALGKLITGADGETHLKDQTDSKIRAAMHAFGRLATARTMFLTTHDIDFAETLRSLAVPVTIIHLSPTTQPLAEKLRQAASACVSALWYNATISAQQLDKLGWWDATETVQAKEDKLITWLGLDRRSSGNEHIRTQLRDMQDLIRFLVRDVFTPEPGSQTLKPTTYGELFTKMHTFYRKEKVHARLPKPRLKPEPHSYSEEPYNLLDGDLLLPPAQAEACQLSLDALIGSKLNPDLRSKDFRKRAGQRLGLLRERQVILELEVPPHGVKHFCLNPRHPAFQILYKAHLG